MEKYIKIEITNDYNSELSYDIRNENIRYLLTELDLYCEVSNTNYINIVEDLKSYSSNKEDYNTFTTVEAIGYSQGECQRYKLYYNKDINKQYLKQLVTLLERSFTHQNDYFCTKKEILLLDGKEYETTLDYTSFCINTIEFPEAKDIIKEYTEQYGEDYDKILVDID